MSFQFDEYRFSDYPLTVIGFHGTSGSVAEEIFSGRSELKVSAHEWEWLGDGVYFWENAPARALQWAIDRKKENPTVIGAIIQVGHCLNLMDKSSNFPIAQAFKKCKSLFEEIGIKMPDNNGKFHNRDSIVINSLHVLADHDKHPYDTVRAAYIEGDPLFEGTEIRSDTHIQICVRDPKKSIVAYFRPRIIR